MFGLTIIAPPVAQPIVLTPVQVPDAEYAALAKRIGADHIVELAPYPTAFETFLAESGILVYDSAKVKRYLNRQYGRVRWGFRAFRRQDNPNYSGHFLAADGTIDNGSTKWRKRHNGCLLGDSDRKLYNKPVPYPALLTIERINQQFPDATFWISDEARRQMNAVKDPFLLVLYGGRQYIIERWDEPKFRP